MSDGTILNPGIGGDVIVTEDLGDGTKIPATKIHTGAAGSDGGAVTDSNPLPVTDSSPLYKTYVDDDDIDSHMSVDIDLVDEGGKPCREIHIGGAVGFDGTAWSWNGEIVGTLVLQTPAGQTVTIYSLLAGSTLKVQAAKIIAEGTTCNRITVFW